MKKRDIWHVVWMLVLVIAGLLLALTLVIAYAQRESSVFANFASIWGLFVGLIGFLVTIYTLFETQRVAREAQSEVQRATVEAQQSIRNAAHEAQEAVRNVQEQTRQILERVRHGVRHADFLTLHLWVRELRTAAKSGDWHRALFFAEECPAVAERLRHAEGLEDGERQGLREAADNLRLIWIHIHNHRLGTATKGLSPSHAANVESLTTLLERLGGRLHHEPTKDPIP